MISVFLGPSLPKERAEQILGTTEARIFPPAAQGDIYCASRSRPRAIVLIDGYFNEVPAPWHKEILWALSNNIPVIGAASMGALRAAELDQFGMIGLGEIYADYASGELVADDEVVLMHGDAASDYVHFSVPLVDIRATLCSALSSGIITEQGHAQLLAAARELTYPERSYERILDMCKTGPDFGDFNKWVKVHAFSQKALDAEAALRLVVSADCPRFVDPDWGFERTAMWDDLVRKYSGSARMNHDFADDDRIDALEQNGEQYRRLMINSLARLFSVDHAQRSGRRADEDQLLRALAQLRLANGLETPGQVSNWMDENNLSAEGLTCLLEAEVHLDEAINAFSDDIHPLLLDQMRIEGIYRHRNRANAGPVPGNHKENSP